MSVPDYPDLPVGTKIRCTYPHWTDLFHVRGTIDGMLVVRSWRKSKQRWSYEVLTPAWWLVNVNHGGADVELPTAGIAGCSS